MDTHAHRGALWRSRWAAIGAAVAVSIGAGGAIGLASAAPGTSSHFISITPVRVLDTRNGVDVGLAGPFVSPVSQDLMITGNIPTTAGAQIVVPTGATGVVLNVTVVQPSLAGFLSVRPADAVGAPATSSLNFEAGVTQPNAVTVQVPTIGPDTGEIELTYDAYGSAGATTDVLVDVVGYYAPQGPPRTEVLTVPWAQFFPGGEGGYGYAADGHVGRTLTGTGGNGGNRLQAALELPQGATINSVTFGIYDNGASTPSPGVFRFARGDLFGEEVAVATVTGASSTRRAVDATVDASKAVVDNENYLYVATVFMSGWTEASNVEVDYVTIRYTVTR